MDTLTVEKVRNQVFKLTFFNEGYRIDDVDSLLDKIAESLAAWETHHPESVTVTSDMLVPSQLPVARFRGDVQEGRCRRVHRGS